MLKHKLAGKIGATLAATAIVTGIGIAAADSASATTRPRPYSTPLRVDYGQRCTPGHNEGTPIASTRIVYTGSTSLSCFYTVYEYKWGQLVWYDYIGVGKIQKRCPGGPIQQIC